MKAWVFRDVGAGLTEYQHSGGGLMVIAGSADEASALLADHLQDLDAEPLDDDINFDEPDALYVLADRVEPRVWIFPDAGCC